MAIYGVWKGKGLKAVWGTPPIKLFKSELSAKRFLRKRKGYQINRVFLENMD